ncbi:MAG: chemotaxis protein CheR, partial [Rhodospirillaceae bacterium]|nr:chemotaxis protein CheR [Rhodospirillales bacterium]MBC7954202.1 chemotaxis protein CheR [Rhodospirillales bacterium]
MRPEDFDFIAKLLKDRSGLIITRDKAYLLESRLTPVARKRGLKGLDDLVASLRSAGEDLLREVTEAMTTNESFFFRDIKPFDQFKDVVLPAMLASRNARKTFRIWSA